MSIIYDALQKTQKNLENKRDANIRKKIQWLDKGILVVIASLLVVNLFVYYPHFFRRTPVATPMPAPIKKMPSYVAPTPLSVKPVTTIQNAAPVVNTVKPRPKVVSLPQPIVVQSSVPENTATHPSAEALLVDPHSHQRLPEDEPIPVMDSDPAINEPPLNQSANQSANRQVPAASPAPAVSPPQAINEASYQGRLVLNGVFLSDQDKIALINNQTFHVGDVVDGLKIVSIDVDAVRFQSDQGVLVLRSMS